MAEQKLKGKKVAILAADMFERVELEEPRKALEEAGAKTEVVSIHDGEIQGFDHFEPATTLKVDRTVEEVSPEADPVFTTPLAVSVTTLVAKSGSRTTPTAGFVSTLPLVPLHPSSTSADLPDTMRRPSRTNDP